MRPKKIQSKILKWCILAESGANFQNLGLYLSERRCNKSARRRAGLFPEKKYSWGIFFKCAVGFGNQ